jgi:hypothetical protein
MLRGGEAMDVDDGDVSGLSGAQVSLDHVDFLRRVDVGSRNRGEAVIFHKLLQARRQRLGGYGGHGDLKQRNTTHRSTGTRSCSVFGEKEQNKMKSLFKRAHHFMQFVYFSISGF